VPHRSAADQVASDGYPGRGLDERLQDVVAEIGPDDGRIVVIADAGPATIRACRVALTRLPAGWQRVWSPRTAQALVAGLVAGLRRDRVTDADAAEHRPRTVIWLDELERYLTPDEPELAEQVAAGLRAAVHHPRTGPVLIVGTLPVHPDRWLCLVRAPASGGRDRWAQTRALLREATIVRAGSPSPIGSDRPPTPPAPSAPPPQEATTGELQNAMKAQPQAARVVPTAQAADLVPVLQMTRPPVSAGAPITTAAGADTLPAPSEALVEPQPEPEPELERVPELEREREPQAEPEPVLTAAAAAIDRDDRADAEPDPDDADAPRVLGSQLLQAIKELAEKAAIEPPAATTEAVADREAVAHREAVADREGVADRDAAAESAHHAPSWVAVPLPPVVVVPEPADLVREQARSRELAGNLPGAERLYERAAIGGDLDALSCLGRLRARLGAEQLAEQLELYRRARDARNTGVLFSLAAAGHGEALGLLRRLQEEAARPMSRPTSLPAAAEFGKQATGKQGARPVRIPVAAKGSRRRKRRRSR
jgi:hypothetical protein